MARFKDTIKTADQLLSRFAYHVKGVVEPQDLRDLITSVAGVAGGGYNVTIAYAASATTDGIEVTYTVVDKSGTAVADINTLQIWVSDDADGSALTATTASGAFTVVTGTILNELTAKKHYLCNTDANGVLTVKLVDSANTAGERFCVAHPVTSKAVVGDATVAGDYEGG